MANLFPSIHSYLFVIKHINDNLCYQWQHYSQPFFHMLAHKNPDAILYTNWSGSNLNVSLDQSCLIPPGGQTSSTSRHIQYHCRWVHNNAGTYEASAHCRESGSHIKHDLQMSAHFFLAKHDWTVLVVQLHINLKYKRTCLYNENETKCQHHSRTKQDFTYIEARTNSWK